MSNPFGITLPAELGKVAKTFKPSIGNLIAGVIIGLLMVGGGGFVIYHAVNMAVEEGGKLPLWVEKGSSWGAVAMVSTVGVVLIVGGFFLMRWIRSLWSLEVIVGEHGFLKSQQNKTQFFAWDEIRSVKETVHFERIPLVKGVAKLAMPTVQSRSFDITRRDGEEFGFNANYIRGHEEFAALVKVETDTRNIPWTIVEDHS